MDRQRILKLAGIQPLQEGMVKKVAPLVDQVFDIAEKRAYEEASSGVGEFGQSAGRAVNGDAIEKYAQAVVDMIMHEVHQRIAREYMRR